MTFQDLMAYAEIFALYLRTFSEQATWTLEKGSWRWNAAMDTRVTAMLLDPHQRAGSMEKNLKSTKDFWQQKQKKFLL